MYNEILEQTLKLYESIPVFIPSKGILAGFTRGEVCQNCNQAFKNDNFHFPTGTAFLKYGIKGISDLAKAQISEKNTDLQNEMLNGVAKVYEAIVKHFEKTVEAIDAEMSASGERDERLCRIKDNMVTLSKLPPQNFEQGVQLYYFIWRIRALYSSAADLGRLDVHLKALYEKDIESGRLTEDEALSIICEFYEKLNECNSGDTLIQVSVGGLNQDGEDEGSRLSYLMLKAITVVKKSEPHINVRLNKKTRADVYNQMLEVQYLGHGQGTAYYDENVIPALIKAGIPEKLAYAYTNDGCTEITFDGYSGIDFTHIDAVACFEAAVNNGEYIQRDYFKPVKYFHKDNTPGIYHPDIEYGYQSGDVEACKTYQEFYECFLRQFRYQVNVKAKQLLDFNKSRKQTVSSLFLNGTFEQALLSGNDIFRGGFEIDYYQLFSGSLPTVADNLYAVKKAVFEDKLFTVNQLKNATAVNYEGYEAMRRILLNYPKFGNDIDEVDQIAADLVDKFCEYIDDFNTQNNILIVPDLIGWKFLEESYGISATFDGRKYADPIAEHYCATPGRALNGPTAIINSIGKAKLYKACGVAAVHISLPRKLADTKEESLQVLRVLVEAAKEKGLLMLNIAIYDVEKLRQAQLDPEHNEDVIVRVWGYSAKFVDLCKEMQEHVISRVLTLGE